MCERERERESVYAVETVRVYVVIFKYKPDFVAYLSLNTSSLQCCGLTQNLKIVDLHAHTMFYFRSQFGPLLLRNIVYEIYCSVQQFFPQRKLTTVELLCFNTEELSKSLGRFVLSSLVARNTHSRDFIIKRAAGVSHA